MNAEVRFRGRRDVPLDEVGRREALEAAENLKGVGLTAVYSSPLERARDVGRAIVAACDLPDVVDQDGLVNVDYGRWEGLTKEECTQRDPEDFRAYAEDPLHAVCPDGEALASAADRIVAALVDIAAQHPGESIAAVTHGAMVRLAVLAVEGDAISDWQFKLPTGSATVLEIDGRELRVISVPDRTDPDPVKASARPHVSA
jgi:alpha-ribazole phosphatase/probable phosphoglycerate mutase